MAKRLPSPVAKAKVANRSPVRVNGERNGSAKQVIEPFNGVSPQPVKKRVTAKERAAMKASANDALIRSSNPQRSPVRSAVQKPTSPKKANISPTRASMRMSIIKPHFEV